MSNIVLLQGQNGENTEISAIAIVDAATSIQPRVFSNGDPRPFAFRPSGERRLLVKMTVEQNLAISCAFNCDCEDWGSPFKAVNIARHPFHRQSAEPTKEEIDCIVEVAIGSPFIIKGRRKGWNLDEISETGKCVRFPLFLNPSMNRCQIHVRHGNARPIDCKRTALMQTHLSLAIRGARLQVHTIEYRPSQRDIVRKHERHHRTSVEGHPRPRWRGPILQDS